MIQRHQDYQLTIPTLPIGGLESVPLKLDPDAPFNARFVITRNLIPTTAAFRFRRPSGALQSNFYRQDCNTFGGSTTPFNGKVLYPELLYPADGTIWVDVANLTNAPLTGIEICFRGSKVYQDGSAPANTVLADGSLGVASYPGRLSTLPFVYKVTCPTIQGVDAQPNIPVNIASDSDFAYRGGYASPFVRQVPGGPAQSGTFTNLYATLRDQNHKAYSNQPIHVDILFGPVGGPLDDGGTNRSGMLWPEVYIQRNGVHYIDLVRNDIGGDPVDLQIFLGGVKVFHR